MGYDVIIIGLGAMGSSAALHLARRGVRTLGLEQFDIPNNLGSSHGSTRMIRLAYYEHPDYVPLLQRAYTLWSQLQDEAGETLLHLTGGLYLGPPGDGLVAGSLAAARQHQLAHESLSAEQVRKRFPQFQIPDDWTAVYEDKAGYLSPERVIAAQATAALRHGATLQARERVISWQSHATGVRVITDRATYEADRLLLAGGAWSAKLLAGAELGIDLKLSVTRQPMGWFWPKRPGDFEPGRLPVWAIGNPDGSLFYGFPMQRDVPGFKIAHHGPQLPTDPDQLNREAIPADEAQLRGAMKRFLPDANGSLLAMRICMYTNSPDHHFIIDRHPTDPRVTFACGFSGHGFKFASVIGEVLADLVQNGEAQPAARFLGLNRFREPGR